MTHAGPGIHEMSMEAYIAHPAISRGVLLKALIHPALGKAAMDFPGETTDPMRLGTATHMSVYEQEKIPLRFSIWKETYKDEKTGQDKKQVRRGAKWEAHLKAAQIAGRDPNLTESQYAHALSMGRAVREHEVAGALLARQPSRKELVIIFEDSVTGLLLKVRIDQLIEDELPTVADLKTCASVEERAFTDSIIRYGYDIQTWLYPAAFRAIEGGDYIPPADVRKRANAAARGKEHVSEPPPVNFVITAVEKDKTIPNPKDGGKTLTHAVRVFEMERWMAGGHMRARYALDILAKCRENNEWPSYPLRVERLDPPDWYLRQWGGRR